MTLTGFQFLNHLINWGHILNISAPFLNTISMEVTMDSRVMQKFIIQIFIVPRGFQNIQAVASQGTYGPRRQISK